MMIRVLLVVIFLGQATAISAGKQTDRWPVRVLSFAYLMQADWRLYDRLKSGSISADKVNGLVAREFGSLAAIFDEARTTHQVPGAMLATLRQHCWIKWQPGFTCGSHKDRARQDQGFFYVSDPVEGDRPFLLLVMSDVAPRLTYIYRLFEDELELIYDSHDNSPHNCGLDQPGVALFLTYNAEVSDNGRLLLYETEGFHSPHFPRRTFELSIKEDECKLLLLNEQIPFLEEAITN